MTRARPHAAAAAGSNLPGPGPEFLIALSELSGLDPCHSRSQAPSDIEGLAANLAACGQINPLIVRRNQRGGYTLLAGDRRVRALLLAAGAETPAAVRARVRVFNGDDDAARALSLAENACREALHPLDEAEAFAALARAHGFDQAASDFGLTRDALRRKLALAALSPRVKAAWRESRLSLASAEAFTADPDPEAQDALLSSPDAESLLGAPLEIRKRLLARFVPASAAIARFVGVEAYAAAGGDVIEDLFGAEPQLTELALLRRLAARRLDAAAAALRVSELWGFAADSNLGFEQAEPDYLKPEAEALAEAERLLDSALPEAREAAHHEIERIHCVAMLRAVPRAERHRFGVHVSWDSEGRLAIERGLFHPSSDFPLGDRARPPAAPRSAEPPGPEADRGSDASGPEDAPSPALAGERSRRPDEGLEPEPLEPALRPLASTPRRPLYVPAADAPLLPAARRIAEKAASLAIADRVAGDEHFALAAAIAACATAGPHLRPVRIVRDHGPRGVKTPWLLALAKLTFAEALAAARAHSQGALDSAFAEIVASSIDLRGADPDYGQALLPAAAPAEIAENFDYQTFFREASNATALLAIREVGGEALERNHAWRDHSGLAEQAALLAKARGWLPEFLRTEARSQKPEAQTEETAPCN